jgi:hypothetical protein
MTDTRIVTTAYRNKRRTARKARGLLARFRAARRVR